jgi:DNA repair exonuclease SbcCD ATPase subunit
MQSSDLQKELEVLGSRRDDLRRELESAQETLTVAREAMLSGKPKAIDALTTAQARVTALSEAIAALVEQESLLQQNFDAAIAAEKDEATRVRAIEAAARAAAGARQIEELDSEFSDVAQRIAGAVIRERAKVIAAKDDFHHALRELLPTLASTRADVEVVEQGKQLLEELRASGANLDAVLWSEWSLRRAARSPLESHLSYKRPAHPFDEALGLAVRIMARLLEEEERESDAA